jgi:predicted dehydrogenase
MGGGTLRDNGIHLIDTVCYFLGEVAEIRGGVSGSVWGFPGCEDNGFVLLRNTRGNLASVASTWNEWRGYHFRIEICGTRGSIRTSCFPMITDVVWAPERGGRPRRERFLFPWVHLMEKLRSYRWVLLDSFVREFEAFERAVRGEDTPLATGRDGLVSIEIAHAASSGGRVRAAAG